MSQNIENLKFVSPYEWDDFCRYLQKQNRFVLNKKWDRFIETVLLTGKKRERTLKNGEVLFRARVGKYEEEYKYEDGSPGIGIGPLSPQEIGAPPSGKAIEGRINPKGISYLYLAKDRETAIAEVRPWLKQSITVGHFILNKEITVIDATKDKHSRQVTFVSEDRKCVEIDNPSEEWEPFVWRDINLYFSFPLIAGEEHNQYVPTQYLSECFKNAGYDGILYKSSFTKEGYNIVLFDPNVARLLQAQLFDIESITYKYEESYGSYFCEKK